MKHTTGLIFFLALIPFTAPFLGSCTVSGTYLRRGFHENERNWLKSIALVTEPPKGSDVTADHEALFLEIAGDYLSHHREFIFVRKARMSPASAVETYCKKDPGLDGILFHRIEKLEERGGKIRVRIRAALYGCREYHRVWEATAENSYRSDDDSLTLLTNSYRNRVGSSASKYAAPFYQLVRKLYHSLPDPVLDDRDLDRKIEADAEGPREGW